MARLLLLGSGGELPAKVLAELSARHDVAAIVQPQRISSWRRRLQAIRHLHSQPDAFPQLARKLGIPVLSVAPKTPSTWSRLLTRVQPDIICIASFPWLLPPQVFDSPRLGAINLHTSLLPQRRGPSPMFWVYYHDDRVSGVTVHRVTARADQGAVLAQEAIQVPRGMVIQDLYNQSACAGAKLMASAVDDLERGIDHGVPQDDSIASKEPRVAPGAPMVDFRNWPVERVWHFLHGLYPHFQEPLCDAEGRPIRYQGVGAFEKTEIEFDAGAASRAEDGWRLQCRDGWIHLLSASAGET